MDRDAMLAEQWDRRLELAGSVDRTRPHRNKPEAAAQIKSQPREIAVGHRQPQPRAAFAAKPPRQRFNQGGPCPSAGRCGVEGHQFSVAADPPIGGEAAQGLGDQRLQSSGVDDFAVHDDRGGPPSLAQKIYDPFRVGRNGGSDRWGGRVGWVKRVHLARTTHQVPRKSRGGRLAGNTGDRCRGLDAEFRRNYTTLVGSSAIVVKPVVAMTFALHRLPGRYIAPRPSCPAQRGTPRLDMPSRRPAPSETCAPHRGGTARGEIIAFRERAIAWNT